MIDPYRSARRCSVRASACSACEPVASRTNTPCRSDPRCWPAAPYRQERGGAVRMAQGTGAPIVPVAVWGSHRLLTKWRPPNLRERGIVVDVHYGEPYHPVGDPIEATAELMGRIRALLEHAWDVYPQQPVAGDEWWAPGRRGADARGGRAPDPAAARATPASARAGHRLTGADWQARRTRPGPERQVDDPALDPAQRANVRRARPAAST